MTRGVVTRTRSESAAYLIRIGRITLASTVAGGVIGGLAGGMAWGGGVVLGALWALANLVLVRFLVVRWLRAEPHPGGSGLSFWLGVLVKFPLLYGVGYLLLASGRLRIEALVIGFVLPFVAAFIAALADYAADCRQVVV